MGAIDKCHEFIILMPNGNWMMTMLQPVQQVPAAPDLPLITDAEAGALARAIVRLFEHWDLADAQAAELLGGLGARTWARWKAGNIGRIDRDLATRMSILMGIHKGTRYMFTDKARSYAWIKKANQNFGGESALNVMLRGSIFDLQRVRAYLDAERGAW